ncbi:hypothetical protein RGQ29_024777 [Quercus rubra]|uniref:C2H2-type domain-containing protein n=1 Tax=Quercus rubra TaxID=3512 RepID=A0AAN7EXS4_QUERU|nr:hypothetical protein RGQ29_024777 [Quercus rubra]
MESYNHDRFEWNDELSEENNGLQIILFPDEPEPIQVEQSFIGLPIQQQSFGKHICNFCHRKFSCGQALGGHKRIHSTKFQSEKFKYKVDHSPSSSEKSDTIEPDIVNRDIGKFQCCLCFKEFKSRKSLSGHMKYHPNRNWRGIQPPQPELALTSPILMLPEHDKDGLPRWTKTAKRGRGNLVDSSRDLDPVIVAADVLISLAQDKNEYRAFEHVDKRKRMMEEPQLKKKRNLRMADQESVDAEYEWRDFEQGKKDKIMRELQEVEHDIATIDNMLAGKKMEKRNWESKVRAFESQIQKKILKKLEVYKCSTCARTFTTFQALGGHRSSHTKHKKPQAIEPSYATKGKEFATPTGQVAESSEDSQTFGAIESLSLREEANQTQTSRKVLDFDLNEPFFMED